MYMPSQHVARFVYIFVLMKEKESSQSQETHNERYHLLFLNITIFIL